MLKKALFIVFFIIASFYLLSPIPAFPSPPPGSLISTEPGDSESVYRRAFYTQLSRTEIIAYYKGIYTSPFITLNHPPEDAQTAIRDQTKSSWLEQLVHPGKDSLYINGFYPTKPTEQFNFNGVHWQGKITVRLFPSHPVTRLTVLLMAGVSFYLLTKKYV